MESARQKSLRAELTNSSYRVTGHTFHVIHRDLAVSEVTVSLVPGYSGRDHLFDRTLAVLEEYLAGHLAPKRRRDLVKWLEPHLPWTNGRPQIEITAYSSESDTLDAARRIAQQTTVAGQRLESLFFATRATYAAYMAVQRDIETENHAAFSTWEAPLCQRVTALLHNLPFEAHLYGWTPTTIEREATAAGADAIAAVATIMPELRAYYACGSSYRQARIDCFVAGMPEGSTPAPDRDTATAQRARLAIAKAEYSRAAKTEVDEEPALREEVEAAAHAEAIRALRLEAEAEAAYKAATGEEAPHA